MVVMKIYPKSKRIAGWFNSIVYLGIEYKRNFKVLRMDI